MALPRPGLRTVLLGLAAFLASTVLVLVLTGDRMPGLDAGRLAEARARWAAARVPAYRLALEIEGGELARSRYDVAVSRTGKVTVSNEGRPLAGDPGAYTAEGLFDLLERELALAQSPQASLGAAPGYQAWLAAEFDDRIGLPLRFRRVVGGGPGKWVEWRVTGYSPE